ncbi:hypothetical protein O7626_40820 [Micromonospora sp. WMMD1102]|uniref:DUF6907 domain-containing protein n=1 Tax=Micromonospora sp. WMMD1102 TaxID=3016105 RepID=UPI002414F1F6|nr:hypothetical protein [Micromonospora sp. WMMD1102]MDG4790345.1 hypothetical protein [Micromonospora sp. WMMD1102]MDG4792148.1 hypothetical protein [Micromonospora sp. WMMD1102]
MTITPVRPADLATPCQPWCGDDCQSRIPGIEHHTGPVTTVNGGTDTDPALGVSARVERYDLADAEGIDPGEPYIAVQVGEWDLLAESGLLTATRARMFAAELLALADAAESEAAR